MLPPTFTTAGGSNRHLESSAFIEGDPMVTPHVFNFRNPEIPHANRKLLILMILVLCNLRTKQYVYIDKQSPKMKITENIFRVSA